MKYNDLKVVMGESPIINGIDGMIERLLELEEIHVRDGIHCWSGDGSLVFEWGSENLLERPLTELPLLERPLTELPHETPMFETEWTGKFHNPKDTE